MTLTLHSTSVTTLSGKLCFNAVPCCPVRMRIRKPKNITLTQLAVVTGVGVSGGIYIYKPLFEKFWFGNKPEAIKTPVETPASP